MVLRNALTASVSFVYGGVTLFAPAFQLCSTTDSGPLYVRPTTPGEPLNAADQFALEGASLPRSGHATRSGRCLLPDRPAVKHHRLSSSDRQKILISVLHSKVHQV